MLLLNTDTELASDAVAQMASALSQAQAGIAGVASKMLSSAHAGIIDAVGTVMPTWGAPGNKPGGISGEVHLTALPADSLEVLFGCFF